MTAGGRGGPRPSPRVAAVRAYAVERPAQPIDLWLDANESPGVAAGVLSAVRGVGEEAVRRYPDAGALERALAGAHGVEASRVLVGAGGDDVLDRICRAMLDPGRSAVMTAPTFGMIPRAVRSVGGEVVEVVWMGGAFPVEAMVGAADERTAVAFIVTPNNPTGAEATAGEIAEVARRLPGVLVVVDLAYAEFADEDPMPGLLALPNVLCVRTLSKAMGMAGLRVGYAVGPAEAIGWARAISLPFAVSGPAIAAGLACVRGAERGASVGPWVGAVREERSALAALIGRCAAGAEVPRSGGNFVLARFGEARRARWLADACAGAGIAVRRLGGGLDDAVRITCPGDAGAFGRLAHAVESALAPEAVLFDMDGVLVDVSASYREAIRLAAGRFGVSVSAEEIARRKMAGDANNDWVVTHRIVRDGGGGASLEDVTAVFEGLYHGEGGAPGLKARERTLVTRGELAALASRVRLGVVTGRPRRDAEEFLSASGLGEFFRVVVAMEDAPAKPDPAPVRLALSRLGVTRAWMVGDTPDDVVAARRAGVVPVGFLAGEAWARDAGSLVRAGAARVVRGVDELLEVMP